MLPMEKRAVACRLMSERSERSWHGPVCGGWRRAVGHKRARQRLGREVERREWEKQERERCLFLLSLGDVEGNKSCT